MNFDQYKDTYHDELERAVTFAGADADFYTEVKASLLVDLARRNLDEPRRLAVLDAGCGPGATDSFLRDAFGELVGVDVSAEMIEVARARNPWAEYRHFQAGEALPFADESFDLSFAICVFHHVDPAERPGFIQELRRVTRPGGIVAIFEHNPSNPATRKVVRDCVFDVGVSLLPMRETTGLVVAQDMPVVEKRFILMFPWRVNLLRRVERRLASLPVGAQYYVAARRPDAAL